LANGDELDVESLPLEVATIDAELEGNHADAPRGARHGHRS